MGTGTTFLVFRIPTDDFIHGIDNGAIMEDPLLILLGRGGGLQLRDSYEMVAIWLRLGSYHSHLGPHAKAMSSFHPYD